MYIKAIRPEPPVEKYVLELSRNEAYQLVTELALVFSASSVPAFPWVRQLQAALNNRDQ